MSWLLVPSLLFRVSSCPASLVDSQLRQSWPLSLSSATCLWFWQASSVHLAPRPTPNATDTCVLLLSLFLLLLLLFVELPCLVARVRVAGAWGSWQCLCSHSMGAAKANCQHDKRGNYRHFVCLLEMFAIANPRTQQGTQLPPIPSGLACRGAYCVCSGVAQKLLINIC